jgi:tetratricopeptide (TPR) repeat protein
MCLSLEPERATARYYRGVCLLKLKRYQEAEEDFNRAIAGNGEPEKSHYSRAICRIKLDNAAGAMEDFDWILLNGTDEELFQAASGMMAQLMAGEIPAIDEE